MILPTLVSILLMTILLTPRSVEAQAETPLERWKRIQCERSQRCQPQAKAAAVDDSHAPAIAVDAGEFTAVWSPWISQDAPGNRLVDRMTFSGQAVIANGPGRGVELQFCDTGEKIPVGLIEKPWKGRIDFHSVSGMKGPPREVAALVPRTYSRDVGDRIVYSFLMPVASGKEGSITLDSVGSDYVTGTFRATYMPSPGALREPPDALHLEISFRARVVPEVTAETASACFRT